MLLKYEDIKQKLLQIAAQQRASHSCPSEGEKQAKWGWARNKISFVVLWLKSDLFSIYQWTSVVRKWLFLTESVDKIGSGTSASVCSRHGWEQSPTNRYWTCSNPRVTHREQDEKTRCSQSSQSKEIILLLPIKGRYLESPVCCHVEGFTNRETTYFIGVDLQRKPQLPLLLRCAQNKKNQTDVRTFQTLDWVNTATSHRTHASVPDLSRTVHENLFLFILCLATFLHKAKLQIF